MKTNKFEGQPYNSIDNRCPHCKENIEWNDIKNTWRAFNPLEGELSNVSCPHCSKLITFSIKVDIKITGVWK